MPEVGNPTKHERIYGVAEVVESWNNTTLTDPIKDVEIESGSWVRYVVEHDERAGHRHYVDFSRIPNDLSQDHKEEIIVGVHADLIERGYLFNCVDFDSERCHVMHTDWLTRRID